MVRMQVNSHVGFNELVFLYWILKWCLQPHFQEHSNYGLFQNRLKHLIQNDVPFARREDKYYGLVHSYRIICNIWQQTT